MLKNNSCSQTSPQANIITDACHEIDAKDTAGQKCGCKRSPDEPNYSISFPNLTSVQNSVFVVNSDHACITGFPEQQEC